MAPQTSSTPPPLGEAGYHKHFGGRKAKNIKKQTHNCQFHCLEHQAFHGRRIKFNSATYSQSTEKSIPLCHGGLLERYKLNARQCIEGLKTHHSSSFDFCQLTGNRHAESWWILCASPVSMAKTPFSRASMTSKYLRLVLLGTERSKHIMGSSYMAQFHQDLMQLVSRRLIMSNPHLCGWRHKGLKHQ